MLPPFHGSIYFVQRETKCFNLQLDYLVLQYGNKPIGPEFVLGIKHLFTLIL